MMMEGSAQKSCGESRSRNAITTTQGNDNRNSERVEPEPSDSETDDEEDDPPESPPGPPKASAVPLLKDKHFRGILVYKNTVTQQSQELITTIVFLFGLYPKETMQYARFSLIQL